MFNRLPQNAFFDDEERYHLRIRRLNASISRAIERLKNNALPAHVTPDYISLALAIDSRSKYIFDEFDNRNAKRRWMSVFKPFSKTIIDESDFSHAEMFSIQDNWLNLIMKKGLCREGFVRDSSELRDELSDETKQAS
ncbi:MAG: hypothetical protein HRU20_26600 [Pseudomonadales bacterium]|nr:hypothetical protein [Pseudomonadales bacterium]